MSKICSSNKIVFLFAFLSLFIDLFLYEFTKNGFTWLSIFVLSVNESLPQKKSTRVFIIIIHVNKIVALLHLKLNTKVSSRFLGKWLELVVTNTLRLELTSITNKIRYHIFVYPFRLYLLKKCER